MRYKCIVELSLDEYNEDGFATGEYTIVPIGSVWEVNDSLYRIAGGNDTIHLDLVTEEPKWQWIEILGSTLSAYFEELKVVE